MNSFLEELRSAQARHSTPTPSTSAIPLIKPRAESAAWLDMCDALTPKTPAARPARKATAPFGAPGLPREALSDLVRARLAAFEAQGAQLPERFREADVRNEWRRLVRLVHPDRNPGMDGTRFTALQSAYLSLVQGLRDASSLRRQAA